MLDPNFDLTHQQQNDMSIPGLHAMKPEEHGSSNLFSLSAAAAAVSDTHHTPAQSNYRPRESPSSTHSTVSKLKGAGPLTPGETEPSEDPQTVIKRQRNTMAARKYRQKRLDRIADLERALGDMTNERDELKLQLARKEAEVEALREILSSR